MTFFLREGKREGGCDYDENRIVYKITNNRKQGDLTYFEQYNCLQTL